MKYLLRRMIAIVVLTLAASAGIAGLSVAPASASTLPIATTHIPAGCAVTDMAWSHNTTYGYRGVVTTGCWYRSPYTVELQVKESGVVIYHGTTGSLTPGAYYSVTGGWFKAHCGLGYQIVAIYRFADNSPAGYVTTGAPRVIC